MSLSAKFAIAWRLSSRAGMLGLLLGSAALAESSSHVIEIRNFEFVPATLQVNQGDSITWINYDIVSHTATSVGTSEDAKGNAWTTIEIAAGGKETLLVEQDMTLDYLCKYHPSMRATLTISRP